MKPTKVIMSCDNNPMYSDFWPSVAEAWSRITGLVPVLVFVGDEKDAPSCDFGEVHVVAPVPGFDLALQAQWARIWYVQFEPETVWVTSDIDMYPLSRYPFVEYFADVPDDSVGVLGGRSHSYFHICYNIVKGKTFAKYLELAPDFAEDMANLMQWSDNRQPWFRDEHRLCYRLRPHLNSGLIVRKARHGDRVDRRSNDSWRAQPNLDLVSSGGYIDMHSIRPYAKHRDEIHRILDATMAAKVPAADVPSCGRVVCSVLCPSRGRSKALKISIASLLDKWGLSPLDLEILYAFDDDDQESARAAAADLQPPHDQLVILKRHGYANLHKYYNTLADIAKGDWLFLWNDDAIMLTQGWGKALPKNPDIGVLHVESPQTAGARHSLFPIVSRNFVQAQGFFSCWAHCDTWLGWVAEAAGVFTPSPIHVMHDRADCTGNNNDATYKERQYQSGWGRTAECQQLREHCGKLLKTQVGKSEAYRRLSGALNKARFDNKNPRRVGFLGMGKLGLPCALALEAAGHSVIGHDPLAAVTTILDSKELPYREEFAEVLLPMTDIKNVSVADVVSNSDIIFVPIQTPHQPLYEGVTPIPDERMDFDYTFLIEGVKALNAEIDRQGQPKIVVIISTVLPGTIDREIRPLLGANVKLCYNPFFIAMGTTISDFVDPEFVLLGVDDEEAAATVEKLYATVHDAPVHRTTIKNAELIKVAYNTWISTKIAYANTMMEICHKTGADVDDLVDALSKGHRRIISPSYMRGGMGDGGGCHPRDNIALSWLARELNLSYDFFDSIMMCREKQSSWLADLMLEHPGPYVVLGTAFKRGTNLTAGSPARLLIHQLLALGHGVESWDPHVDDGPCPDFGKATYLIGTNHDEFVDFDFPKGSTVIDPWRIVPQQEGVTVIGLGAS